MEIVIINWGGWGTPPPPGGAYACSTEERDVLAWSVKVMWRVFLCAVHVDRRCPLVAVLELHVRCLVELAVVRSTTAWTGAGLLHRTDTIYNPTRRKNTAPSYFCNNFVAQTSLNFDQFWYIGPCPRSDCVIPDTLIVFVTFVTYFFVTYFN